MPPHSLTAAQLALQAERRAAKEAKKAAAKALAKENGTAPIVITDAERSRFLKRDWVGVGKRAPASQTGERRRNVRVLTWNILAQTLVRRELFPGSDCLKWSDRRPMLLAELAHYGTTSDIICLQECDRLDDLAPALRSHKHVSTKGRNKLHGLVVFYRSEKFRLIGEKTVYLDEEDLSLGSGDGGEMGEGEGDDVAGGRRRRGGSRQTKNVGLIAALEEIDGEGGSPNGKGVVVATTHLFWHPKAIRKFQTKHDCLHWQAVLAGDLNIQPYEATYQLLTSPQTPLHPALIDQVEMSRIVHTSVDKILSSPAPPPASIDPSAQPEPSADTTPEEAQGGSNTSDPASTGATGSNTPADKEKDADEGDAEGEGEGEGEGGEPDSNEKSIANTRPLQPSDGILPIEELVKLFQEALPRGQSLTSAYASGLHRIEQSAPTAAIQGETETFASRGGLEIIDGKGQGGGEPGYTCFTPLFKLTLDYLFLFPPSTESQSSSSTANSSGAENLVVELLRPAQATELGEGLPRKSLSASDHLAVGVGLDL